MKLRNLYSELLQLTNFFCQLKKNDYFWGHFYLKIICKMKKFRCSVCGYVYDPAAGDPDSGIEPGTSFENLPDNWECPLCGVGKDDFEPDE